MVEQLYEFAHKQEEEIRERVAYLIENDRFQCHPLKHEVNVYRLFEDLQELLSHAQ